PRDYMFYLQSSLFLEERRVQTAEPRARSAGSAVHGAGSLGVPPVRRGGPGAALGPPADPARAGARRRRRLRGLQPRECAPEAALPAPARFARPARPRRRPGDRPRRLVLGSDGEPDLAALLPSRRGRFGAGRPRLRPRDGSARRVARRAHGGVLARRLAGGLP